MSSSFEKSVKGATKIKVSQSVSQSGNRKQETGKGGKEERKRKKKMRAKKQHQKHRKHRKQENESCAICNRY